MLLAGACPSCQFSLLVQSFSRTTQLTTQPWQAIRPLTTMKRASRDTRTKASRMTLSRDLARPRSKDGKKPFQPGPFAGMNQTEARVRRKGIAGSAKGSGASENTQTSTSADGKRPPKATRDKDDKPLFHALKMQATLAPLAYSQRTAVKQKLELIESFDQFNLLPDIQKAIVSQVLVGMTNIIPTPAQKLAIPAMLSKKTHFANKKKTQEDGIARYDQFLIAAETGSGKTLAYLLPVIDALKRQEVVEAAEEEVRVIKAKKEKIERRKTDLFEVDAPPLTTPPHATTGRPRVMILLPSSELVTQVGSVAKSLSHVVKYRCAPISSIHTAQRIRKRLYDPQGVDLLISTPHLISSIAEKDPYILSRVTHLVIDEADSLLDRSFSSTTSSIIDRVAPSLKQLVLCSATIPRSLDSFLEKRFPDINRLVTPKIHSIPRRVQLGVIDIERHPYQGNRNLACAEAIWSIGKAEHDDTHNTSTVKCMIVFVNERDTAEEVATYLSSKGIDSVALTRDTKEQRHADVLQAFTSPSRVEGPVKSTFPAKDFSGWIPFDQTSLAASPAPRPSKILSNTKVLVTTDLGSRGIDTLAVRHVVLYDVPHTTIDFVHRLGRVGRMGRRGRAIVLTGKHDRKDVVSEVKEAMFRGQALI